MMIKLLVSGLVLLGASFTMNDANRSSIQDDKDAKKKKAEENMQKVMSARMPGDAHKQLAKLAGKWNQASKFVMEGEPPMEYTGTIEYKTLVDGLFVMGEGSAKVPGPDGKEMPFHSVLMLGYNNATKQYESTWVDSMGSGFYVSAGTADASGKVITLEGKAKDAITPEGRAFKVVIKVESDDKHVIEWWDSMEAGKAPALMGTITETRAK